VRKSAGPSRAKRARFDAEAFLSSSGSARTVVPCTSGAVLFEQGEPAKTVLYVQSGRVKLSVLSPRGREAVVAILGPGDFVGEGALAGQARRVTSARCVGPTTVLVVEKKEMARVLRKEQALRDRFLVHVLARTIRLEADLLDQLFNKSEKRLARALLLLAGCDRDGEWTHELPKISQEVLAEIVGTTRSRVNFFMNQFRKLGFVDYSRGAIRVNHSLLEVVLHD
jgi:CRP/FNR family transcriptional regulator, cyclic AMP receptor protein